MTRFTRILHRVHRWTGLLSGVNILILSLTGSYLVFSDEVHHLFHPERTNPVASVDMSAPAPYADAFAAVQALHPEARPFSVRNPDDEENILGFGLMEKGERYFYELDLQSGEVFLHADSAADRFNEFVLHLHADLFMGALGVFYLGFVAILFFISTVSGIIIYSPFMKDVLLHGVRWRRGLRRDAATLHKLVGFGSLSFNLIIAVTAIAVTLGFMFARMWLFNEAGRMIRADNHLLEEGAPLPPIDEVWKSASALHPDIPISSITYPGSIQGPHHYLVFHADPESFARFVPVVTLVPAANAAAATTVPVPLWIKASLICIPFHFGNFGGLPLKIAYSILGLSAGLLSISGVALTLHRWAKRLRTRKRSISQPAAIPAIPQTEGQL